MDMVDERNLTSHTHDEETAAQKVFFLGVSADNRSH